MPDFLQGLWSSALSLCIINEQGFVEDANLALCTTLGYPSQQLIGTDMMLLLAQGDASKTRQLRQQFRDKRYAIAQGVWQLRAASGCHVPLQVLGSWITKREGNLYKLVVLVHEACTAEGNAVLERHVLNTPALNQPQVNTDTAIDTDTATTIDTAIDTAITPDAAVAHENGWSPPTPPSSDTPSDPTSDSDNQRLRQRVIMLEGQLSAYKAALERYKVPTGIHFEEGAWYIQLPEAGETPTKTTSNED
jgi:PAS domain S-box-containing protein